MVEWSGGDSAAVDRRSSGEEAPGRAKLAEGVGFDDIHPQIPIGSKCL